MIRRKSEIVRLKNERDFPHLVELAFPPEGFRDVLLEIDALAPIPAVRQKRSKELSTSCQAVSRLGTSASDEGVVIVVMALLSFADSTPRA